MPGNDLQLVMRRDMYEKARGIIAAGGVLEFSESGAECRASVVDEYSKNYPVVELSGTKIASALCTCRHSYENGDYLCPHTLALAIYAVSPERLEAKRALERAAEGRRFMEDVIRKPARRPDLRLEPVIHITCGALGISLRAGGQRMYIIRDVRQFVDDYEAGRQITPGKGSAIDAAASRFERRDELLLAAVHEAALGGESHDPRLIPLNRYQAKRVLRLLHGRPYAFQFNSDVPIDMLGIADTMPDMRFELAEREWGFILKGSAEAPIIPLTPDCEYIFCNDVICHVAAENRRAVMTISQNGPNAEYSFGDEDEASVLSELVPALERLARVDIQDSIRKRIITEPMSARVEIEPSGRGIAARVRFTYGSAQIDPYSADTLKAADGKAILKRDMDGERAVTDILTGYGFSGRDGQAYLSGDESVYRFLLAGIEELNVHADVFADQSVVRMRPRRTNLKGKMTMGARGIEFRLMMDGVEPENTPEVLAALKERKRFVRLLDGSFLSLKAAELWDDLAREVLDNGVLTDGRLEMEAYRTIYLNSLLDSAGLDVERDGETLRISQTAVRQSDMQPPIEGLRAYQRRGFNWLNQLFAMSLGGILADDMGLGKTVQMLSAIKQAKIDGGQETSLVVAPTSLVYNWAKEVEKFAPDLSVTVLEGGSDARAHQIEQSAGVDILIVSYAQVRRDIQIIRKRRFRFCVLDEAQNIKNFQSVGAIAVKRIDAKARFALTGTPMENHIGELWSVFDFILPGYLGSRVQFLARYQDGAYAKELSVKIRPFLMRRLKKDVLSELPDKIEDRIIVEMSENQQKVYKAMLQKIKSELIDMPNMQDFGRNRMRILAAITRLRQICCHPSLFLENYRGGSGKLDVLMAIVSEGAREGRKMLVFSQFTSMLAIIREQLGEAGVPCYYLDGDVPPRERTLLCDRFNQDDTPVFLISLKAGGTGLNLTGAEMVIHFDPWWNPAVEEQATDRAHRIGQTRKVHVLRLIARGTIEEKVADLQAFKKGVIDAVVKPGEVLPAQLNQKEILSLFE